MTSFRLKTVGFSALTPHPEVCVKKLRSKNTSPFYILYGKNRHDRVSQPQPLHRFREFLFHMKAYDIYICNKGRLPPPFWRYIAKYNSGRVPQPLQPAIRQVASIATYY
ncbi:hypothetical protein AVEN_43485-1 [Araneus ventricosus]|uniref:Uncharacterized protein n=1 Tax=Araneus ventricosus TaxID=182803 RepID=A0A4Y2GQV7_ARAVE|nr:hypothetical protein AVEN_43485-1 [Araneus ventricosus]